MENLCRRGFPGTCACCSVSFAWEIARDSPIVNIVSQTILNSSAFHEYVIVLLLNIVIVLLLNIIVTRGPPRTSLVVF